MWAIWMNDLLRLLQPVLRPETNKQVGAHEALQAVLQDFVMEVLEAWIGTLL
jgi:hypothetical protein